MAEDLIQVTRRVHPPGDAGIRSSLREVALGMGRGRDQKKVLRWTRNLIEQARIDRGYRADTDWKRAELIFQAAQVKVWTPDPVGTEFMAGAHLLACDISQKDEDCFSTGDCDDKSRLLGAAFLSVGLHAVAVGHSYSKDKRIGHVLVGVRIGDKWYYADPTPANSKLGDVIPYTYEEVYEPFGGSVVCSGRSCLERMPAEPDEWISHGVFVGVGAARNRGGIRWRKLGEGELDTFKNCKDIAAQAKTRDEFVEKAAGCAAEAYCTAEGIPPQICGKIGAFVGKYTAKAFSAAQGALGAILGLSTTVTLKPQDFPINKRLVALHNMTLPNEAPWTWKEAGTAYNAAYLKIFGVAPKGFVDQAFAPKAYNEEISRRAVAEAYVAAEIGKKTPQANMSELSPSSSFPTVVGGAAILAALWWLFL